MKKYIALTIIGALLLLGGSYTLSFKAEEGIPDEDVAFVFLQFITPNENDPNDEIVVNSFLEAHGLKEEAASLKAAAKEFKQFRKGLEKRYQDRDSKERINEDFRIRVKNELVNLKQNPKLERFLQEFKKNINKEIADEVPDNVDTHVGCSNPL